MLQQSKRPAAPNRQRSTCDWAAVKAENLARRRERQAQTRWRELALPLLVRAGRGLAAIKFCLAVEPDWILQQVVEQDLPTPHDKPMRRSGCTNPWTADQIRRLIQLWPTNLFATTIAEDIGRTPASVRYKAKWLGLPLRDRSKLVDALPDGGSLAAKRKTRRWTVEEGRELGNRFIRGQHTAGIAKALDRSFAAVNSRAPHIGLVGRHEEGGQLTMEYDPDAPVLEQFTDWKFRQCNQNAANWFWSARNGNRTAPATKKTKAYQESVSSDN